MTDLSGKIGNRTITQIALYLGIPWEEVASAISYGAETYQDVFDHYNRKTAAPPKAVDNDKTDEPVTRERPGRKERKKVKNK